MSNIRRKTAEHLASAWNQIPHVTQHDKADITALEELRKKYAPQAEKAGGKLTMTAIALKIVAAALQAFPAVQRVGGHGAQRDRLSKSVHVGVAVDTPTRPARAGDSRRRSERHRRSSPPTSRRCRRRRARGKLSLDEMQGGGFTITNLGGIGGTSFTPIVNWPEVAILGISRARDRAGLRRPRAFSRG